MDDNDNPLAGVIDDSNPSDDVISNDKDDQFKQQRTTNTTLVNQGDMVDNSEGDIDHIVTKKSDLANIVISVKNVDNLEEFTSKQFIQPEYIPKL